MSSAPYAVIERHSKDIINLEKVRFLLRWDSDVTMPKAGTEARAQQIETLHRSAQQQYRSDKLVQALEAVDETGLGPKEQGNVRELRREQAVMTEVPVEVIDRQNEVTSAAHDAWKAAKETEDWDRFAPYLDEHFEVLRERATHDPTKTPFEAAWLNRVGYAAQPHLDMDTIHGVFETLREELVPLAKQLQAAEKRREGPAIFEGSFDVETQRELSEEVLDLLGLDRTRARFDLAPHPFSFGTQYDVRMSSRFEAANPLTGLMSTIHEFGHTQYTHNLPREDYGTPAGEPAGPAIHESQSRFYENHIGRSRAFWEWFLPRIQAYFPDELADVTVDEAYRAVNRVCTDNPYRTAADEVTYHLHILIRTEIEQAVMNGERDPEDIPAVWNEKYQAYLNITPESVAEGPLQDPHWAGHIPGFIGYTLGSVIAAQLAAAMEEDIGPVAELVSEGEIEPITDWMAEHIHRFGRQKPTDQLIEEATGRQLSAEPFMSYLTEKYGALYDL